MVEEGSVYSLITSLSEHIYDKEISPGYFWPQSRKKRQQTLRSLRTRCYEILLNKSSCEETCLDTDMPPAAHLVSRPLILKGRGRYRDADHMKSCVDNFLNRGLHLDPVIDAVIQFLLRLEDSVPEEDDLEPRIFRFPEMVTKKNFDKPEPYPVYPRSVFEPPLWMVKWAVPKKGFEGIYIPKSGSYPFFSEPGSDLPTLGRFITPVKLNPNNSSDGVTPYSIPHFPELKEPRDLEIPKLVHLKPETDEGYASSSRSSRNISPSGCVPKPITMNDDEIWEAALKFELPRLRTWEKLGHRLVDKEPPFLSEAGHVASEHFYEIVRLSQIPDFVSIPVKKTLSTSQFLKDLAHLMEGIESHTFPFIEESNSFEMACGIGLEGVSFEALSEFCEDFLVAGSCCRRLQAFTGCAASFTEHKGVVLQSLKEKLKVYLEFHWAAVLLMPQDKPLLEIKDWAQGILQKMFAMSRLCCLYPLDSNLTCFSHKTTLFTSSIVPSLPMGGAFVSYLYKVLSRETHADVCNVLYSLLQACSQVYFRFLQRWIFEGVIQDVYQEFFVFPSSLCQVSKDRKSWTNSYQLVKKAVPDFLCGMENDILLCGKTINLLKSCCPKAPLCVALESGYPSIPCCLLGKDVRQLLRECSEYEQRVRKLVGAHPTSVSELWKRQDTEAQLRLLHDSMKQAREQHLLKIKLEREAVLQQQAKKKQLHLAELRQQIQEAKERREEEREQQLQEDAKYLERMQLEDQEFERHKEEEKQRIIQYYEELSEMAAKRKRHAEWRMERMQLHDQRVEFLAEDRRELKAAIEMNLKNSEPVARPSTLDIIEEDISNTKTEIGKREPMVPLDLGNLAAGDTRISNSTETDTSLSFNNNEAGDINENNLINLRESTVPRAHILDTINEDLTQGNVISLEPLVVTGEKVTQNGKDISIDNARTEELQEQTERHTEDKSLPVLSALERNRRRVLEQEFDIRQDDVKGPHSIPISEYSNNITGAISGQSERIRREFEDNINQRNRNRWNMLHGNENITGSSLHFVRTNSEISTKTPEDEDVDVHTPDEVPMSISIHDKYDSSCSTNVVKSAFSSKTSSCYNIASIASSNSFDLGSGKFSLNTPVSTDSSLDAFKVVNPQSCATPIAYWKSSRFTDESDFTSSNTGQKGTTGKDNEKGEKISSVNGNLDSEEIVLEDIDFTLINVALQKSVSIPLFMQLRLANEAVLKYFFEDLGLYRHLVSLRSYFFLMDGEYGRNVTSALFNKISTIRHPRQFFNFMTLNMILREALDGSLGGVEENAKRLSFGVNYVPEHFQLTSTEVLKCLSLKYHVEWPLNIILTERALTKYDTIFGFLLKVRLVSWSLEETFHILKGTVAKNVRSGSEQCQKLYLWRHEMTFFVRAIQNYITATVLQSSWEEFEKELEHIRTLDDLYMTHVSYVKKVLFRCLLYNKHPQAQNTLTDAFNVILKFHAQLEAGEWQSAQDGNLLHSAFKNLSKLYLQYKHYSCVFFSFISKLAIAVNQSHYYELLEMLNANNYYSNEKNST